MSQTVIHNVDPEMQAWQEEVREYERTGTVSGLPTPGVRVDRQGQATWTTVGTVTGRTSTRAPAPPHSPPRSPPPQRHSEIPLPPGVTEDYDFASDTIRYGANRDLRGRRLRAPVVIPVDRRSMDDGPAARRQAMSRAIAELQRARENAPLAEHAEVRPRPRRYPGSMSEWYGLGEENWGLGGDSALARETTRREIEARQAEVERLSATEVQRRRQQAQEFMEHAARAGGWGAITQGWQRAIIEQLAGVPVEGPTTTPSNTPNNDLTEQNLLDAIRLVEQQVMRRR